MEKYKTRYGKVWKDRRTGKIYGEYLELPKGDSIMNYTQVTRQKETVLKDKAGSGKTLFKGAGVD